MERNTRKIMPTMLGSINMPPPPAACKLRLIWEVWTWNALARSFQGLNRYHRIVRTTSPGAPEAIPWDDPGVTVG